MKGRTLCVGIGLAAGVVIGMVSGNLVMGIAIALSFEVRG